MSKIESQDTILKTGNKEGRGQYLMSRLKPNMDYAFLTVGQVFPEKTGLC